MSDRVLWFGGDADGIAWRIVERRADIGPHLAVLALYADADPDDAESWAPVTEVFPDDEERAHELRDAMCDLAASAEREVAKARADGVAEERTRIVAKLRESARAMLRHDAQAVVLGLADSVERGGQ